MSRGAYPLVLLAVASAAAVVTGVGAEDKFNWIAETFPAFIGGAILVATWKRFPFTATSCTLVFLFALILFTGGRYTYAKVPLGEWMKGWFGFERNHFDRIGHVFQGVIPAMLTREMLLRCTRLHRGPLVFVIACGAALSVSALYEIFEWRYAVAFGGEAATDFLGSQGDPWDAQQDMTMALLGAVVSQALLGGLQSRQIARLPGAAAAP